MNLIKFRFTTGVEMREIALEEKEPSEEFRYLRTDWQELSEMGPQFDINVDLFDYNIDKEYWKN